MTQLLAQALDEVKKLPLLEQDAIAAIIMDELVDEQRWADAFANSQDKLAKLAKKVRMILPPAECGKWDLRSYEVIFI